MKDIFDIAKALKAGDTAQALSLLDVKEFWDLKERQDFSRVDYSFNSLPDIYMASDMAECYTYIIEAACKSGNIEFLDKAAQNPRFAKVIRDAHPILKSFSRAPPTPAKHSST